MREPRVYTGQGLDTGKEIELGPAAVHRLSRVLRLLPGDPIRLFNGNGAEYQASIAEISNNTARAEVGVVAVTEPTPKLTLNLLLGISKGEHMDFAIRKAVELGVSYIRPLQCTRSVVRLKGERLERRLVHWRGILVSACEQSGRCRLPVIDDPETFSPALDDCDADCRLVMHHRGSLSLERIVRPARTLDLLIGPEGGLESSELELAQGRGFIPLRLGPRIMRTETAPLAALAAIQMLWGDFRTD